MNLTDLQFNYTLEDEDVTMSKFFEEEGTLPFNTNSKIQMQMMMEEVCHTLALIDDYSIKKLEMMLKYELPFFTVNRRLVRNWVIENFIY